VGLGVVPHVEDFGEVLAAGIAGDAQLGDDGELSGLLGGIASLDVGAFDEVASGAASSVGVGSSMSACTAKGCAWTPPGHATTAAPIKKDARMIGS
jgi:hypothetical protein